MATLTVLAGPDAGAQFPLAAARVTVGRHSSNAVALTDHRVSRKHLELRPTAAGGHQLFDLQSGNGTHVNGRLVQVIDLRPGDRIELGDTLLAYAPDAGDGTPVAFGPVPLDATRLVVQGAPEYPSAIVRTVAAEAGRDALRRPGEAAGDWLRGRLASLAVMYEASAAASRIADVDELLARLLDLVLRTTDADQGCVLLLDPVSNALEPHAVRGRAAPGGEFVVSRTIADHVLTSGEGVLVADAAGDERFRGGASVARHRLREVICVPMAGRHGTVGVIFLDTTSGAGGGPTKFSDDHLTLAVAVAHQAAVAVEEARHHQQLVQAERLAAVGQTIAAMSHHIKNIMQGVRFGSDMVRMALPSGPAAGDRELLLKGWRLVEKNQAKIDDLILDMLSYSKEREPALESVDLLALAADVIDVVRGRAERSGIAVEWQPTALPPVTCDPDGIHRALLNILSNAVDALSETDEPRVVVTTALSGGFAELVVSDNGPGVPAERAADLFKPFVSSKGSRGTGLGLPVSRKILREHGGDVTVESDPGRGATFRLLIPHPATAARLTPRSLPMPKRIAVLVEQKYEELEVWYPVYRLREAGHAVTLVGPAAGTVYPSKLGYPAKSDKAAADVTASDFDALVIPGGFAPDYVRRSEAMLTLVRDITAAGKPTAAICHGPWVLCSTPALKGRTVTCYKSIKDDVTNAGGHYVDREVVVDGHIITSRTPDDLPAFLKALLEALS